MADFAPIQTQTELDNLIKERLERSKKTVTDEVIKQFEGYISPDDFAKKTSEYTKQIGTLNDKIKANDTQLQELTAKNKAYEIGSVKSKVAHEYGIPYELAQKLSGDTEEQIKADAQCLSKFVKPSSAAPTFTPEVNTDNDTAAYIKLANNLK